MLLRTRPIEPCLPTPAEKPPSGPRWLHEIKHDGFRLMARRDAAGARLQTRNGHDWSHRFPLIREAVEALRVRSCLIDGEAIAFEADGLASFELLRGGRHDRHVTLCVFDLIEIDGKDLRREPLEHRKAMLAQLLRRPLPGLVLNATTPRLRSTAISSSSTPARSAARASSRSGSARAIVPVGRRTGSSSRTRTRRP